MAFMMEKLLNDARKLANRLKEHDGSTDNLVTQMTTLNKKIDSMKTFQENLPDLNELVLRKPRSTVKLGLSQENSQIRELEHENKELKQSLEEHELALELIMSRYRQQVAKLLVSNQVDQSMLYEETVEAQEVQDKAEHIYKMGTVMWKSISDDDRSLYDTQQVLAQLKVENQGMRELLQICCSSGNPLRISDRQTQTGGLPLASSAIRNNSGPASSAVGGACGGGSLPLESTLISGTRMTALEALQPGARGLLSDGGAAVASMVGQEGNDQTGLRPLKASACVLPSTAFASRPMPGVQASNSSEKMSSPELYSMQALATAICEKQEPLGTGAVESSQSSLLQVVDKSSEVEEQQPVIPSTAETKDTSRFQGTLLDPATVRSAELVLENHADTNQIPNHLEEVLATDDNESDPLVNSVTVGTSAMQELDNSFDASSPLANTTTASSSTTTVAAVAAESASSQNRQLANSTVKNQTTPPKGAALSSSGNHMSTPSGGTQKNPSPSGRVTLQKNAATPSSASPSSRPKHGAAISIGMPSKTPTRSPAVRDGAPGSPSGVAAVKLSSSGSPSVHSAKISTTVHPSRATPIRIKTTKKTPSVAASVASPTTVSSLSATATSSVPLDSNGNSHTSVAVLNEISNINKMPNDATVDGQ